VLAASSGEHKLNSVDWEGFGVIHPRDELVGVKKDVGYKKAAGLGIIAMHQT